MLIRSALLPLSLSLGRVRVSEDGQYVGAVGIYPPEVRVFDTQDLGLKFSRGFDAEVVDFDFLSPDYRYVVTSSRLKIIIDEY